MDRAAIYVRVSTDSESQRDSPLHQMESCKEYAQSLGLLTSESLVYSDAGLSGTEFERRGEVQRLLLDARRGCFEVVLFTAISRFSRDLTDAFNMKKKLEFVYGIRLISLEEGYDTAVEGRNNDMVFTVHAMLAAHKSKEMSTAIRRGLRQAAKRGHHIGNQSPYGYQKGPDKRLQPDPQTASVVQQIFEWYRSGLSTRDIAAKLNSAGVSTAKQNSGKPQKSWQSSSVHAILRNEVYLGTIIANKWTRKHNIEQSRRVDAVIRTVSQRADSEWVVVTGAHQALITPDLFESVQNRLGLVRLGESPKRTASLLAGVARCGVCQGPLVLTGNRRRNRAGEEKRYQYLVCGKNKRFGKDACTNHSTAPYEQVIREVLSGLVSALHKTLDIAEGSVPPHLTGQADHGERGRCYTIEAALVENQRQQLENLHLYREGTFSKSVIAVSQRQLVDAATKLRAEYEQLSNRDSCERSSPFSGFLKSFERLTMESALVPREVVRDVLSHLVESVLLDESGQVSVYFAFRDSAT